MTAPQNPNLAANLPPQGPRRVVYLEANRPPTVLDSKYRDGSFYEFNTEWRDKSTTPPNVYKLVNILSKTNAVWVLVTGGTGTAIQFTPSTGAVVFPTGAGNVNVFGTGCTVTGTANTLTVSMPGGGNPIESITVQAVTAPGVNPVTPTSLGVWTFNAAAVANHSVPIETRSRALHACNVEIQYATSAASTDATKSGIAHFNSSQFSVDANGFVALTGGGAAIDQIAVDAATAPGTNPVLPSGTGQITVTGAQVAPGVVGANVLRTDSLAANTYTIEIQQTSAVAAKDTTKNGVAHFNSAQFTNDQGFISIIGGLPFESVNVQRFTATGAFTYTPTANAKFVICELQGAGGGAGGCAITVADIAIAGGGSAGGYAKFLLTAAQVGASLTGSVGAGGTAGAAGNNAGGNGGSTTLATPAPWTAAGGTGGIGGAAAALVTINSVGGGAVTAGTGTVIYTTTGGTASAASGSFGVFLISSSGGNSVLGFGSPSFAENSSVTSTGAGAVGYGSGAGGSVSWGPNGAIGGFVGKDGIAIFTEFI